MELRAYLRTLVSHRWIVLITFLITYGATLAFTYSQKPVYQGRATFVVKLNPAVSHEKDLASAVDILSRRTEIATTYTIVANSRLIKRMAIEELALTNEQRSDLEVSSQIVPGTNVVEITAQSPNPALARDFTNVVGAKTIDQVRDLYEAYKLEPLDQATLPNDPIKPNKPLNLILGAVMGLVLGSGLAFLSAYLRAPPENLTNLSILDDETSAYTRRYFSLRLRQELSRARRNGYPLAVALINIDRHGALAESPAAVRREALRLVTLRLAPHLRDEDVMAYVDSTVFALLLPDMAGEEAKETIERLQTLIAANPVQLDQSDVTLDLSCSAGVVAYAAIDSHKVAEPDLLMTEAQRALKQAEGATYSTVELMPMPDDLDTPLLPEASDRNAAPLIRSVSNGRRRRVGDSRNVQP